MRSPRHPLGRATRHGLLASALLLALPVPPSSAAPAETSPTYGLLIKSLANPYWSALAAGARSGARAAQVEVVIADTPSDQATAAQLDLCRAMLGRRPAALLAAAIDSTNLLPCLRDAHRAHIPVVDIDENLNPDLDRSQRVRVTFHIGSDDAAAGARAADFIVQRLGGSNAAGSVLVIEGLAGNLSSQRRADGFTTRLHQLAPHLVVAARDSADWDRQKAASLTRDALARAPDLRAIFACNDGMVMGALDVARQAQGPARQAVIVGVDGNHEALEAIRSGRLDATVAQLPFLLGQEAVLHTAEVLAGHAVARQITIPTLLVTREVLAAQANPLLRDLR